MLISWKIAFRYFISKPDSMSIIIDFVFLYCGCADSKVFGDKKGVRIKLILYVSSWSSLFSFDIMILIIVNIYGGLNQDTDNSIAKR